MDDAKSRLLAGLPHFRHAMSEAAKEGRAQVGILCLKPDRTGQIIAQFDAAGFFDDLAEVLGAAPQSEEDELEAKAVRLVQSVHASGASIVVSDLSGGDPK